jgi:hypothetical protein
VGARLQFFWKAWQDIGVKPWVVQILRDGLKWEFLAPPTLRNSPWEAQLHLSTQKAQAMREVIDTLLEKEAIEEVTHLHSPGYYSILFLRQKPNGEWRPIIDLKELNKLIVNQTFRMESARSIQEAMTPGLWACSIDLTDAYFHVPINKHFRKYLRFSVMGETYQFRALPFGLVIAPRVFTAIMLEIARVLRIQGVAIHQYLDDWLVKNADPEATSHQVQAILTLLETVGLLVNLKKSELVPKQVFEFVGVLYDLAQGRAFPPHKRVMKIQDSIQEFMTADTKPAVKWLSLIGLLNSVSDQVPLGRLRLRPIQFHLREHWTMALDSREMQVVITPEIKQHLCWWTETQALEEGVPLTRFKPDLTVFTDASSEGWGAHLKGIEVSGVWNSEERKLHINILEMKAVKLALERFATTIQSKAVLIATDNTTVLSYLNNQGGTRSWSLMDVTNEVFQVTQSLQVSLRARHIPGRLNVLADRLSRRGQALPTEWSMHPAVLESLWHQWGKPTIDLFATRHNNKLSLFVSPVPDDLALDVDALMISWNHLYVYAYPPTGLIQQVLRKLKESTCEMILIAPYWPEKVWFPDLLALQVCPPVQLPLRDDLLKQPLRPVFHQNVTFLNLHAWRLSNKL